MQRKIIYHNLKKKKKIQQHLHAITHVRPHKPGFRNRRRHPRARVGLTRGRDVHHAANRRARRAVR